MQPTPKRYLLDGIGTTPTVPHRVHKEKPKPSMTAIGIEFLLKASCEDAVRQWNAELALAEWLMYERNDGGGLYGVEDEYFEIRNKLMQDGKVVVLMQAEQAKLERLARKRGRA